MDKKESDVLVIGELNMDLIFSGVESFPELGKEKIARGMNLTLGSSSAIFAANIARLGVNVEFCGMIGNDEFKGEIVETLQEYGVDTSLIKFSDQFKTGLTVIIQQPEDRAMITYPGAMEKFSLADIPDHAFQQARHMHVSSLFLQPALKNDLFAIIDKAKSNGMSVSIDPQWDPDEKWDLDVMKLLQNIDFFLPNEAEFLHLTASETVEGGVQKLKNTSGGAVIIKRGINGATFLSDGDSDTIPTFINEHPVDAVGAGDSFDAGFIYRFLRGDALRECVQFANLTGAVSTTQAGGTTAITSLEEVLSIAKNTFSTNQFNDITR